ncbi:agmatine deiminase family protein [Pontiella agarivorans]|uniref:Agmatine deiminase family protein n=1 Tax=Pontiella agarivorans TaxID=3038953 RepID=A0ABU5MV36_9BACT|nr:agmatine deiminase family protein [Pontiella agarivorans]MDZ8118020.1 agmatine deiminase family protein [Pontiella agarivorans]
MKRRLPAEWEPQDAVLLIWPQKNMDWAYCLDDARATFSIIRKTIERFQPVIIVEDLETNDTWSRDIAPITIEENEKPVLLDFTFNGWGGKFPHDLDNALSKRLHKRGTFGKTEIREIDLILEGGSIESDGQGTLLTTAACLLNKNRNSNLSKKQIEEKLTDLFGPSNILWLENGHLAGDDTDAHIDTLARLAPNKTILYVSCNDPADEHYEIFQSLEKEIRQFQDYRLLPLPWPKPKFDDGRRLPATYANYLVINGAVLVPTYNDPADALALETIGKAFPDREIIGIDCSVLIRQGGSLHCSTMQFPKGVMP